jgi:peptidyl-tRNA hydrolase
MAFGKGEWLKREGALVCSIVSDGVKMVCVKPQTYMNRSGEVVGRMLRYYKVDVDRLIVLHDELDLALGKVRLKSGGGAAGHNGLRSIIQHGGSNKFCRVRMGIDHPRSLGLLDGKTLDGKNTEKDSVGAEAVAGGFGRGKIDVSSWVLGNFPASQKGLVEEMCIKATEAVQLVVKDGILRAQGIINTD